MPLRRKSRGRAEPLSRTSVVFAGFLISLVLPRLICLPPALDKLEEESLQASHKAQLSIRLITLAPG